MVVSLTRHSRAGGNLIALRIEILHHCGMRRNEKCLVIFTKFPSCDRVIHSKVNFFIPLRTFAHAWCASKFPGDDFHGTLEKWVHLQSSLRIQRQKFSGRQDKSLPTLLDFYHQCSLRLARHHHCHSALLGNCSSFFHNWCHVWLPAGRVF